MKALNPEFGVGDIAKELGRRWSDVDPELKSKYEAMAEKDKARYDRVSWDWFDFVYCQGEIGSVLVAMCNKLKVE